MIDAGPIEAAPVASPKSRAPARKARAIKAHTAVTPRDRTAECGSALAQLAAPLSSAGPSASMGSRRARSLFAKADKQAGPMQPSAAPRISVTLPRLTTAASHQPPGRPRAQPDHLPHSPHAVV